MNLSTNEIGRFTQAVKRLFTLMLLVIGLTHVVKAGYIRGCVGGTSGFYHGNFTGTSGELQGNFAETQILY
jgi:hypothetical protein